MISKASKSFPVEKLPENNNKHHYYGEVNIAGLSHGKGMSMQKHETPENFTHKQEGIYFHGSKDSLGMSMR